MKRRAISTVIVVVSMAMGLLAQTSWGDTEEVVVQLRGKVAKLPGAVPHDAFQGVAMPATPGSPVLTFIISNVAPAAGQKETYNPDPKIDALVKGLEDQESKLIDIIYPVPKVMRGPLSIQSAAVYQAKDGEDDPNGYVYVETFDHKSGQEDINYITLSRYKRQVKVLVPAHRDDSGDMVPDDIIMGIANHLTAGQVVYATFGRGNNPTIKTLAPWKNPIPTGKLVSLDPSEVVNANKDTGPAVILNDADGKKITALVPGQMLGKRWVPDPSIMGMVRPIAAMAQRLKSGVDVNYLTAETGDGADKQTWLVSVSEVPKTAAKPQVSHNNS